MAYKITVSPSSFVQFTALPLRVNVDSFSFALPEYDLFDTAFQFSALNADGSPLPSDTTFKLGICSPTDVKLATFAPCSPINYRYAIMFPLIYESVPLDQIAFRGVIKNYSAKIVNITALADLLSYDFGLSAYVENGKVVFYDDLATDIMITYNVTDHMVSTLFVESFYADAAAAIMDNIVDIGKCFKYCLIDSAGAIVVSSNLFKRVDSPIYLTKIRYANNESGMGFQYEQGIWNKVTLPMIIATPQFSVNKKVYRKSNGVNLTLSAVMDKSAEFITDWMPEFFLECLAVALIHDSFQIYDGAFVGYMMDENVKIDWDNDPLPVDRGQATGKLKTQVYDRVNDNLGKRTGVCAPPRVDYINLIGNYITFKFYPSNAANKFRIKIKLWDTEQESVYPIALNADNTYRLDVSQFSGAIFYSFAVLCGTTWSNWSFGRMFGDINCAGVVLIGSQPYPVSKVGVFSSRQINLNGDGPFAVADVIKPDWMSVSIIGTSLLMMGTPTAVGTANISLAVTNCKGFYSAVYSSAILINPAPQVEEVSNTDTGAGGQRTQILKIGTPVNPGNEYILEVYSHQVIVQAIAGDSVASIASRLAIAVNNTTPTEWNDHGSAPATGTSGFPPQATSSGDLVTVILNYQNNMGIYAR